MHRVFIDSDIILDVLSEREPFYISAAKLFTLIDKKKIIAYTSPIVFTNIHYILTKSTSRENALKSLQRLKPLVTILPVDEKIIDLALNSKHKDFEDALQYHTAKSNEIKFMITRNKKDHKQSKISIYTADEYLKIWASQSKDV